MAGYERKSIQILGGGFSCLPPVDKVPITDYLLAQNWRVDALGRLVSRAGYASKLSIAGAGLAHSAGSVGGISSPLYVGCNSGITPTTSAVYYNQNTTPIATGFDGNRIGFASQNRDIVSGDPFMWVMNRGNQGRHCAATGWQSWNLSKPPASPTVAAGSIAGPETISAGSNASPAVLTVPIAPSTGIVFVSGFTGPWAAANGQWTATNVSGTTFSIPVDSTAFGAIAGAPEVSAAGAGVTYTFVWQNNSAYVHSLNIAGATYSFPESLYDTAKTSDASLTVAGLMAAEASTDPNCGVTYPGTGNNLFIAPLVAGVSIPISGSDGNTPITLGTATNLPSGTYQIWLTFQSADLSLESNPIASAPIAVADQAIAVTIPAGDAPVDARIGFVNIYATGGTLGAAYRIGHVPSTVASPATSFLATIPDLQATQGGTIMPTDNDPPPFASGIIGPFFSVLYAWSTAGNVNRLFWTNADLPQYWPGSGDPDVGNWVDVGDSGEEIVWCTVHGNLLVIYKERSIWMMIGSSPGTATLEKVYEACGLVGQFALAPAGLIDYFVGPNGLCIWDMNEVHEVSGAILPLFNQSIANTGVLTAPGSILAGSAFNSTSVAPYAVALGHANGKLYVSYAEQTSIAQPALLVYNEGNQPETNVYVASQPGRWFYHRNIVTDATPFFGFFFDGISMIGLGGIAGSAATGMNVDDFRGFLTEDLGSDAIECVYQSHYEDCGLPDNPKVFLEVAIDFECPSGTFTGQAQAAFGNGSTALTAVGNITTATARTTTSLGFSAVSGYSASTGGVPAKNISVALSVVCTGQFILHNIYIYYYEEARLAVVAATMPTDLGVGKIKQCKELELDIASPGATVAVTILSDLPGNALASRHTPTVAQAGRAIIKYPFAVTEGLLWKLLLIGSSANPFQLYSARLLMRVMAVYVEGYESTAGFVWDSMQQDLGDGDVKTFDQLRFDMEAGGASSVTMLTDLPGEAFATRAGGALALTSGATSRAWVTVPLPDPYGASAIEGRSLQLQVTGNTGFKLYKVQARYNRIGRYLMGTAPDAANDAFTTLEFDFTTERAKMFKRLEVDMRAAGTVNVSVITDQAAGLLGVISGPTGLTTTGRQVVMLPMPPGVRGRLLRLILTSTTAARIYRIRVWTRPLSEPNGAWKWEDFPLDASDVVAAYKDLIAEETPPVWQWVDVPFQVTEG